MILARIIERIKKRIKMAYTYKYPRPAVTADWIVITKEAEPKVLLIQRRKRVQMSDVTDGL